MAEKITVKELRGVISKLIKEEKSKMGTKKTKSQVNESFVRSIIREQMEALDEAEAGGGFGTINKMVTPTSGSYAISKNFQGESRNVAGSQGRVELVLTSPVIDLGNKALTTAVQKAVEGMVEITDDYIKIPDILATGFAIRQTNPEKYKQGVAAMEKAKASGDEKRYNAIKGYLEGLNIKVRVIVRGNIMLPKNVSIN